jgi:phage-related protein
MAWRVLYHPAALQELAAQPDDIVAHLSRIVALVAEHGLERLPAKLAKHIEGELWEFRLRGRDGIARAFYVTRSGQRVLILRLFSKKTQKTPGREIKLALARAGEIA